jgi:hypothetical protein
MRTNSMAIMKKLMTAILITMTTILFAFNLPQDADITHRNNPAPVDSKKLDINNISTWFRTNGSFNRDPSTGNSGFEWPKGSNKFARYASGLWIGAKVEQDTLVCIAEFDYEYLPGYIDNLGNPQGLTDPAYRIYSIIRGDTLSPDYINWPANQGAYLNESGKPFFLGTQTMFYSYTDGYPQSHGNNAGSTAPLKAHVMQTNWAYTNIGLQDVCFSEFKIVNGSNMVWNDCYMSVWCDVDLGDASDDAVGIDTVRQICFTYNFDNNDNMYGANPPSAAFTLLRGPLLQGAGDTAKYYDPPGSGRVVVKPGKKFSKITGHHTYINSHPINGDPSNYRQTYLLLQTIKNTGGVWINPFTNLPSKFPYSGYPEKGTGWIETSGANKRSMMNFGPMTIAPRDTQSIIVAQVIARGTSNLNSIARMRELSDHVRSIYDNNFQSVLSSGNNSSSVPNEFSLHQNYPNPFNPSTIIEYDLPTAGEVVIIIYDVTGREVRRIDAGVKPPGIHKLELNADGLSSGTYLCKAVFRSNAVSSVKSMRLMLMR